MRELIQDETKGVLFSTHITSDLDKIADYICFIEKGNIVFCDVKDEILNKYTIVKGGRDLLTEENRGLFISLRENEFGFQALCSDPSRIKSQLGDRVICEKAGLDDIMLYTIRGNRKDV